MSKIIIACGGTGGHLAPGISIAETLQECGHDCVLLISQKQVDSALIEKYQHLNFFKSPGRAFAGGVVGRICSIWSMLRSCVFSHKIVRKEDPDLVLVFGGFVSIGLSLAARFVGVPIAVHEANCRPGRAVRLIKYLATRVYLPDGVRLEGLAPESVRYLGYPVRRDIEHSLKKDACSRLGITVPHRLLVVIGGSQGAASLNAWAADNAKDFAQVGISIYCVTGLGKDHAETLHYSDGKGANVSATFVPFSDSMGDVISAADIVVSRAGAGSIAEIVRCRAPSILVPYPYAADNHQQANALMHERHGAGLVVGQDDLDRLAHEVKELMLNDWLLNKFKMNLERLDRYDSSLRIAQDLETLCASRELSRAAKREAVE